MPRGEVLPVRHGETIWTAADLRWYLLAMSYNTNRQDFCLPQRHFPKRLTLNQVWQETFDRLRQATTEDGYARWTGVGVTRERDRVVIFPNFIEADPAPGQINPGDVEFAVAQAASHGVPYWVADIFAQPEWLGNFTRSGPRQRFPADDFSGEMLAGLLSAREAPAVAFLVGPTQNRLAFRTQESALLPDTWAKETFGLFWLGWRGRASRNLEIAKRYHLVFYKGKPNQPLARIFPTPNQAGCSS